MTSNGIRKMHVAWRYYLRKQIWAVVLLNIWQNLNNCLRIKGNRTIDVNCDDKDPSQDALYAFHMIREYEKALGVPWNVTGQTIVELGQGPSLAVALALYGMGAKKVICFDKYAYRIDRDYEAGLYRAVALNMDHKAQVRLNAILDVESGRLRAGWERKIHVVFGDRMDESLQHYVDSVDWIVSRSVLEYLDDLPDVMKFNARLLRTGGGIIHKVDLRDDGMFSEAGLHPLTFLTIPAWIYRLMISHSYRPRRWRVHDYVAFGGVAEIQVECMVTRLLNEQSERNVWEPLSAIRVPKELLVLISEVQRSKEIQPFAEKEQAVVGLFFTGTTSV